MATSYPCQAIPESASTINIKAINTTSDILCSAEGFVTPVLKGHEHLNLPTLCFLLENKKLGKTLLFDCGSRKDFWNLSPATKKMLRDIVPGLRVEKNVNEILEKAGVDLKKLDAIVWSHWHWDHCGDASQFPDNVQIIVGPGFKENFLPGYPVNLMSPMLDSDTKGKEIREIKFDTSFKLGRFLAYDFFGDGSFYILDVPGHAIGHMCGLVRSEPESFVFLGGDACHFSGMFRPNADVVMPDPIPSTTRLDSYYPSPCSCSHFTPYHPAHPDEIKARSQPYYSVSSHPNSAYQDAMTAENSIAGLAEFDGDPNCFVCIAHDGVLLEVLPLLNDDPLAEIGDWKSKGYKEQSKWGFLNELPRGGEPGRKPIVKGLWRDGKVIKV